MAFNGRDFIATRSELTGQAETAPGFSLRAKFDDEVGAVHERAQVKANDELLGLASGSMESIMRRGKALAEHNAELARRLSEAKKDDTVTFLAMLDSFASLKADLAEARKGFDDARNEMAQLYGEKYLDVMINTYLDGKAPQRLLGESDEDYEIRVAAQIQKRENAGEIYIDDIAVRKWMDAASRTGELLIKGRDLAKEAIDLGASGADVSEIEKTFSGRSFEEISVAADVARVNGSDQKLNHIFAKSMTTAVLTSEVDKGYEDANLQEKDGALDAIFKAKGINLDS